MKFVNVRELKSELRLCRERLPERSSAEPNELLPDPEFLHMVPDRVGRLSTLQITQPFVMNFQKICYGNGGESVVIFGER